jgi:hypothetical protein
MTGKRYAESPEKFLGAFRASSASIEKESQRTCPIFVTSQNKNVSFPKTQPMGKRKDGFPIKDVGHDKMEVGLQREPITEKQLSPVLRNCQQKIGPLPPNTDEPE